MINILFDGKILKYGLRNSSGRTGIYFVARNLFLFFVKNENVNLSLYLPKNDLNYASEIFESLNIEPISVYSDDSDLSQINAFFASYEIKPDIVNKYPKISCYTVLYDTIPLLFPAYFEGNVPVWYEKLLNSLNENEYYFAISDSTKNDFLKYFPQISPENIETMLLSTNFEYKRNKDDEVKNKVCEKYNIPIEKKYLFSLCSLEPRKNLIRAVKTFIEFIKKNNVDDLVYVLGGQAWDGFIEKFEQEVSDYEKYKDRIIRAGYVDDKDLEILYSNAQWFVYTSEYEGFGMPPLEAMACGCPVITSNNSSLPEVVGDAGIMIDFDSDEQHVEAYEKYYFDEQFRQEIAQKGLERSKLFSWQKAVDIILNKMQEVEAKKAQTPLVTIITATYNLIQGGRKDWFIQNLESVQNQTYKNIEHIVIDGASTDGTIELLEECQQKYGIKYYSEPDNGIYDALNKGILKANGKYVVCLNSDDFYCDNHAVEWLVSKAKETDADACYASAQRVKPDTFEFITDWKGKGNFIPLVNSFPCHQTFLIKTDMLKELDLYDAKYKVSADNIFFIKMINHNKKFVGIENKIITFRDGGFSNSHLEISNFERKSGYFNEYGKKHFLTQVEINNLFGYNYLNLSLSDAISLGAKLVYTGKEEWIKEYFTKLLNTYIERTRINTKQNLRTKEIIEVLLIWLKKKIKQLISNIFLLKNEYSGNKKYKVIMVLGIKLKIKVKKKA